MLIPYLKFSNFPFKKNDKKLHINRKTKKIKFKKKINEKKKIKLYII